MAKAVLFRQLYEYVRTPLAFEKGTTHFSTNLLPTHLLLDKDNSNPSVLEDNKELGRREILPGTILYA